MEQKYLIDTNVISHLLANRLPEKGKHFIVNIINTDFIISVAVEIEVLTHHEIPDKMQMIEKSRNGQLLNHCVIKPTVMKIYESHS
jgi:predicted nucleic acid-binding protein